LRVKKGFTEPDLTAGDKANLPSGRSWNQPDIAKIVPKRADNRDVTYSLHFRQRVHQPLVLALRERVHQDLSAGVEKSSIIALMPMLWPSCEPLSSKLGYRLIDSERLKIDALVGFRCWYFGENLSFTTNTPNFSGTQSWVDPLVGGRITGILTPKVEVTIGGDVGGWGVGSQIDFQIVGLLAYRIKPALALQAGYRYLYFGYRRASGAFLDTATSGVIFGVSFTLKYAKRFSRATSGDSNRGFMCMQQNLYFSATRRRSSAQAMRTISLFSKGSKMDVSLIFLQDLSILTIPGNLPES
jgi:hypothetical protein